MVMIGKMDFKDIEKVIKTLKKWSGKLIEPKYTKGVSSSIIKDKIFKVATTADIRKSRLKD